MRFPLLVAASLIGTVPAVAATAEPPKQLIIISFDGAHDNKLWDRSRALAARTHAHFTYFLSCTFYIARANKHVYQGPHEPPGKSNVGFAPDEANVQKRLSNVWQAHLEGHDIGSHACGHFDGKDWSEADWKQEFANFRKVLKGAWKANHYGELEPRGWDDFVDHGIIGFRAPYLSLSDGLVPAEKASGFTYDASLVSKGPAQPLMVSAIPRFALPEIPEGPEGKRVIGMDYNLYVRHSHGEEDVADKATFETRALDAYRHAFEAEYNGNRIPLQLGFHFVEMNGGAYWDALDTFLGETCSKKDVACVSYAEALKIMGEKKADGSAF
jgi:peptidoglycan/xylan/chitin deacetylase (PgdA/CDA1 family)